MSHSTTERSLNPDHLNHYPKPIGALVAHIVANELPLSQLLTQPQEALKPYAQDLGPELLEQVVIAANFTRESKYQGAEYKVIAFLLSFLPSQTRISTSDPKPFDTRPVNPPSHPASPTPVSHWTDNL